MITRLFLITGLGISSLFAQVYTPPSQQPARPSSQTDTSPSSSSQSTSKSPFGSELPFLDPTTETISWNGKTWSATDNRFFGARFEKFLAEPPDESEAAAEYRESINAILTALSPNNPKGPQMKEAFKLLPRASLYPGDAKLCDTLAQAVYTSMLAKKDINGVKELTKAMDEEKRRLARNSDVKSGKQQFERVTDKDGNRSRKALESHTEKLNAARIIELTALQKLQRTKTEIRIAQAKVQYQAMIMQFFMQRRFEHVVMATRFYTMIWRDGDASLEFDKNSDVGKLFANGLGMNPTVGTLDSMASEAIRDVDKGVKAFKYLLDRDELTSASKRLTESYMMGEFLPPIATLDYDSKRKIQLFVRQSYQLIGALDVRDYATAKAILDTLTKTVKDFDGTKARAAIATYTRVSDMSIMMAKTHLASGDTEAAQGEIRKAMEAWPQNPKLNEFDKLVQRGGSLFQARNDFDRLLSEKNYREIVRRQYELVPAISDQPEKLEAFEQIMKNITKIEAGLEIANRLKDAGQPYGAYENLRLLRDDFPDDPVLAGRIADLSSSVSVFTNALDKAKTMEERTPAQTGTALSWYLEAKRLHPQSTIAQEGIDRLLDAIMPE